MVAEISSQAKLLVGSEVVAMAAHQGKQSAIFGPSGIEIAPAGEEMMVDDADHMETVGDDAGVGEVQGDQRCNSWRPNPCAPRALSLRLPGAENRLP